MTIDREKEVRWESRLWTLFRLGLVGLVGFLSLQALDAQKLISAMVVEQRLTNQRLDRIDLGMDRINEDRYRMQALSKEHDDLRHRVEALEDKLNSWRAR